MEHPATRKEAIRTGVKFYFTGKPCKHGHVALRLIKGTCVECRKMEWQESNEKRKEYFKTSPVVKAVKQRYYERNREAVISRAKARPKTAVSQYKQKYKLANPDLYRVFANTRRRRFRQATPKWVSAEERKQIRYLYAQARDLSQGLGVPYEVDHIYPLASDKVCGLHVLINLRVIPKCENLEKSNKLVDATQPC